MWQPPNKPVSMVQSWLTWLQSVVAIPPSSPVKTQVTGPRPVKTQVKQEIINRRYSHQYSKQLEDMSLKTALLPDEETPLPTQRQYPSSHSASKS